MRIDKTDRPTGRLTTGQAARLCSLKPDTILKWIKKGKLPAIRTAGGHHRIDYRDIAALAGTRAPCPDAAAGMLRCWEYLGGHGIVREACKSCIVYRVRAAWCFELLAQGGSLGHARQFCPSGSCEECAYYERVRGLAARVLVVSADPDLTAALGEHTRAGTALCFAANAYEASGLIPIFRPAFVIVDQALPGWRELAGCLARDTRAPGLKVVLAMSGSRPGAPPEGIDALLAKPFDAEDIAAAIRQFPVETATPAGV